MSYDSKTYGQSPFGNPPAPDGEGNSQPASEKELDRQPKTSVEQGSPFPTISTVPGAAPGRIADTLDAETDTTKATRRKSRASSKTSTTKARKSKKATSYNKTTGNATNRTSKAENVEPETAEAIVARRFLEEDRKAYLSLLYKTAISGLVWAVLRLVRYQVSERAIATINIIIHPVLVSALALIGTIGLTFWLRHLLKDLALHTQQLSVDAEATDGKNYRPTLEIVGDSLEYNPNLRKQLSRLFDVASILICTLISYVMTSLLLPWE